MEEILNALPLADIGSSGLVALFVLMIMTGYLVPRRIYNDKVAESQAKDEIIKALTDQVDELHELARAWTPIISHVQDDEGERRRDT